MELGDLALGRFTVPWPSGITSRRPSVAPDEAWVQERYGAILLRMGKASDALAPLQRAIQLEPYYAESYWLLAKAREGAGDKAAAIQAYQQFLERAPRRDSTAINDSQRRWQRCVNSQHGRFGFDDLEEEFSTR
jgi:predicted Zn-dependent protease